ncbi:MAG: hypothetical protein EOO02_23955 [Chitinophagaceae bacterium]|nr:MAG: hypothetical protein EOO02_23955 [Chitinophagaceae bacterium]
MKALFAKAEAQWRKGFPFVLFRKPDDLELVGIFQQDAKTYHVESFEESGYAFVPFGEGDALLLPMEHSDVQSVPWQQGGQHHNIMPLPINESTHQHHIRLVQKGIKAIKDGRFSKVVLSRKQMVSNESVEHPPKFLKGGYW